MKCELDFLNNGHLKADNDYIISNDNSGKRVRLEEKSEASKKPAKYMKVCKIFNTKFPIEIYACYVVKDDEVGQCYV
jgi:hypothetical protein